MKALKMTVMVVALTTVLSVGPAFAQTAPPPQNPPTQPPAATQPPAEPKPEAQKPFPEGGKIAFIDLQVIAQNSAEGKAATAQIQAFSKKRDDEIAQKNKQAQDLQTKLQQGGTVLSEQARGQAEKDLQKLARELQAMQEDRNADLQELTQKLQDEFQARLNPVIEQVANERNLHVVFSVRDSGIIWAYGGIDISDEVIKRFDAAAKTAPAKK